MCCMCVCGYYLRRRLASGECIVSLGVTPCVCVRRIALGGEGNAMYCALPARPDRHYYRTAHVGQTVKFPCETDLNEPVNWKRTDRFVYIYRMGRLAFGSDRRMTIDKDRSYTLTIRNITTTDATSYACVEDGGHGSRRFYVLSVTGSARIILFRLLTLRMND